MSQDHKMQPISQLYNSSYTPVVPKAELGGMTKPRRRRNKKNKDEGIGGAETYKKRKLTDDQINLLEISFDNEHKLDSERKDKLALELGLDPRQVAVWFQNRRARWKNKKLEEEYTILKNSHHRVVTEKSYLETKVMKLKEQLLEAEKVLDKLSETSEGILATSSSSSSLSTTFQQEFPGEFTVGGFDDFLCVPDVNYIHGIGWVNLSGL